MTKSKSAFYNFPFVKLLDKETMEYEKSVYDAMVKLQIENSESGNKVSHSPFDQYLERTNNLTLPYTGYGRSKLLN